MKMISGMGLVLVLAATLCGCDRMAYGPRNGKLSADVTKQYAAQFEALGITEIVVNYGFGTNDYSNASVTAKGNTIKVSVDMSLNGSTPFQATISRSSMGTSILVRNDDDHTAFTYAQTLAAVDRGIDQALADWKQKNATAATWSK